MDLRNDRKFGRLDGWIPDSMLYVGILLMIFKAELSLNDLFTVNEMLDNVMTAGGLLILLYYALRGWPDFKGMLFCGIGLGIIGVAALRIRNFHLLITAITVLALRNADIKKTIRMMFNWKILFMILITLGSFLVLYTAKRPIGSLDNPRFRFFIPSRYRFQFGYRSTTAPGDMLFSLTAMWCYLNFGHIRKRDAAVIVLLSTFVYILCVARMPYLLTLGMLAVVLFYQKRGNRENPLLNAAAAWMVPALSLFFLIVLLIFPNWPKFIWKLDDLLTRRMARGAAWYVYWGLTLLGRNRTGIEVPSVTDAGLNTGILDNLYQNMDIWMGMLPMLVIILCFYLLARRKKTAENVMIVIWAIYSITETSGLNCYLQFPLILVALALPNIREEGKTEWLPFGRKPDGKKKSEKNRL